MVGMLLRAAAHQHDALNDVVDVVEAGDAEARQIADASPSATSPMTTGAPWLLAIRVWRISSAE